MNAKEAREIFADDNWRLNNEQMWRFAKGFLKGWNARGEKDADIAGNNSRYSLPGMTSLQVSEEITEAILKLSVKEEE